MKLTQSLAFIITGGASFIIPFALANFTIITTYSYSNGGGGGNLEACPSKNSGCDCSQPAVNVAYDDSAQKMTIDSGLCGMGKLDVYLLVTNSSWQIFVDGDASPRGICNTVPGAVGPMPVPVLCAPGGFPNVGKLFSCISDICSAVA